MGLMTFYNALLIKLAVDKIYFGNLLIKSLMYKKQQS